MSEANDFKWFRRLAAEHLRGGGTYEGGETIMSEANDFKWFRRFAVLHLRGGVTYDRRREL